MIKELSVFIVAELVILLETIIKRRMMKTNIDTRHTRHFAGENLNHNLKLFVFDVALSTETNEDGTWFMDSGASTHMTCNKHWYENFKETNNGYNIYLGDDRAYHIKGYGDIHVILPSGNIRRI